VVESDKADMDVESFAAGILGAIVVPEGGEAGVGSAIAYIAETEADLEAAKAKGAGGAGGQAQRARVCSGCLAFWRHLGRFGAGVGCGGNG
jgi:pyruvate/2-oxoglutarate dehydrogenase complex dihydrolipoamide acyltransferase (E2) component